jgi:hypothetical protein
MNPSHLPTNQQLLFFVIILIIIIDFFKIILNILIGNKEFFNINNVYLDQEPKIANISRTVRPRAVLQKVLIQKYMDFG